MKGFECPILFTTHIVGRKWAIPIIEELFFSEKINFNDLKKSLKHITSRTLSKTLKDFCNEGFIEKKIKKKNNISYTEYSLTKKGEDLHQVIERMKVFGFKWYGDFCCKYK